MALDPEDRPHQRERSKVTLSSTAKRVVKLLALAFVIHVFVIPQLGGARRALSVLGAVDPFLIGAAIALEAASLLAYAWLTRLLLPPRHRPSLPIMFGTVMASTGVSHVVPGGAAASAAVNVRLLSNAGVPGDALGFALGLQAVGSAVVLNLILWLALVVSIPVSGLHPIYVTAATGGAVVIGAFAAAVVAMRRGSDTFADLIATLAGRLPKVGAERVRSTMVGLAAQLDVLSRDHRRLALVLTMAAANWLLDAVALWVALSAFGPAPGLDGLMVAYGLANVLAAIPISPGGLGVVEAVLIPTLVGFGTPTSEASIGVVAYRLVSFWLPIPVGALCYVLVARATSIERRRVGFRAEVNDRLDARRPPP